MPNAHVFDKAVFHLDAVRRAGLPDAQAAVHIGLFFGWIVARGLHASWLEDRAPLDFEEFRSRRLTGAGLLATWDGALLDDMLGDEGLAFTAAYYGPAGRGWGHGFLDDYAELLASELPNEFSVPDSWESFDALAQVLDERHGAWRDTYDPSSPRLDLRTSEPTAERWPDRGDVVVVPVSGGVALPHGPLGLGASRPGTVAALETASVGGRIGLFPTVDGRAAEHIDDVLPIGVWATVERLVPSEHGVDALLACGSRIGRRRWVDEERWVAEVRTLPEPKLGSGDEARLEELRHLVGDALRRRQRKGEAPGLLALGVGAQGASFVDLVAPELGLSFEEQLLLLEEPELRERIEIVRSALMRATD